MPRNRFRTYELSFTAGMETRLDETQKLPRVDAMHNAWMPRNEIGAIQAMPGDSSLVAFTGLTDYILGLSHGFNKDYGRLGIVACTRNGQIYYAFWDSTSSDEGLLLSSISNADWLFPGIAKIGITAPDAPTHALSFDGTDDEVDWGNNHDKTNLTSFTIEILYRGTTTGSEFLFGKRNGLTSSDAGYALYIGGAGKANFEVCDGTNEYLAQSDYPNSLAADGAWHRITGVYDASADEITIYVDGEPGETTSTSGAGSFTNAVNLKSGEDAANGNDAVAEITDYRIWSAAKTQAQIQEYAFSVLYGDETDLAGYWKVDEGTGTSLGDSVGAVAGTITGASWIETNEGGIGIAEKHRPYFFIFQGSYESPPGRHFNRVPQKSIVGTTVISDIGLDVPDVSDPTDIYVAKSTVSGEENNVRGVVAYFLAEIKGDQEGPYSDKLITSATGEKYADCGSGAQVTITASGWTEVANKNFKVYRTLANGTLPFEVGRLEIDGSGNGTFSSIVDPSITVDNAKDTEVGDLPYLHGDVVPNSSRPCVTFVNRIFVADGNRLYWSDIANPQSFWIDSVQGNWIDVSTEDGDYITALAADRDGILIFKSNHLYKLYGRDPDEFNLRPISPTSNIPVSVGAPNMNAVCEFPGGLAFYWNQKVYVYSSETGIKKISGPIESPAELGGISDALQEWRNASIGYNAKHNQIWFSCSENAAQPTESWIYDLDTARWVGKRNRGYRAAQSIRASFEWVGQWEDEIFVGAGGDSASQNDIVQIVDESAVTFVGSASYDSYFRVTPFYGSSVDTLKTFLYVDVVYEPQTAGQFDVIYWVDGKSTSQDTKVVDMSGAVAGVPTQEQTRIPIREKGRSLSLKINNTPSTEGRFKIFKIIYGYIEYEAIHDD